MAYKASGDPIDLLAFFDDLVRCETRLYNALNDRLRERHGIVTSQFEVLRHLRGHPGCRVAHLAAVFAVGVGAASKSVDRLEARGWLARQPNPADRRSSLLALTDDGRRLAAAAEEAFTERLAELLGDVLGTPGLPAAARLLSALRAGLEGDRIGLPTG